MVKERGRCSKRGGEGRREREEEREKGRRESERRKGEGMRGRRREGDGGINSFTGDF